jgi:hypothetical protein
MTIAVVATLLIHGMGNWGLIVVGVALIIGANDVTNPDARTKADNPCGRRRRRGGQGSGSDPAIVHSPRAGGRSILIRHSPLRPRTRT